MSKRLENAVYAALIVWALWSAARGVARVQSTNGMNPIRGCQWP